MKLYYAPGACSLAAHIALREAGVDVDMAKVDLRTHTLVDGSDFRAVNPRGYVPVLVLDNGEAMSEVAAILQYIADYWPKADLAPAAGSMGRYRLMEWLAFFNSEIHKPIGLLFDRSLDPGTRSAVQARLSARLDWTSWQFGDKPFLLGETFSVADAYLYACLRALRAVGLSLADWPLLLHYANRVAARPAVDAALRVEELA